MLSFLGTVALGGEDILGTGDCDISQIILCKYLFALLFMAPGLSKGM